MIDLRSDVCAPPTEEMWEAMRSAPLGWAPARGDPSVARLESVAADMLGQEAAVWTPTCGMANLAALLSLVPRDGTVVLEASAHILTSEGMGIVHLGGIIPRPVEGRDGRLEVETVEAAFAEDGAALLCLENTHTRSGGCVVGVEETSRLVAAARRHGARVHLDGARLANAAVALGAPLTELSGGADTVALSLNKGLCAPLGAVLAGGRRSIEDARVVLHRLGGASVHKAGIAAAAGLIALEQMVDRLAEDHRRARELALHLSELPGVRVTPEPVETNILFVDAAEAGWRPGELATQLAARGVLVDGRDEGRTRLVTHRGIGDGDVERSIEAFAAVIARAAA